MKLLFLINDLSSFFSHRLPIAEAARAKKIDVIIAYGDSGGADSSLLERKGFRVKHIPMERGAISPYKDFKTLIYLWKFFRKENPDIVHLVAIKPYLYGGVVSRLLNVPSVVSAVSGLGTIFISKSIKHTLLRILLFNVYKFAFNHINQKVIFQNFDDLKLLCNWGVLKQPKTILIKGSGVQLKNFTKVKEPEGIITICFAARILRDKGVYEFVSAARLLNERGVKARFILAGDIDSKNPSRLSLEEFKKLKEEKYIEVLGYQTDIATLYANSHIICLPSYREGLPKSLMEAAAASRVVVTTDVPGCRDAIIPNKTGLLVPVKNSQKLADALQWLIENPEKRQSMGLYARKFAEKEFPIEKIVQKHLEIYSKLFFNAKR